MTAQTQSANTIAHFWEWYEWRQRQKAPLAGYALDRCEEAFRRSEWEQFGYWFTIFRDQKPARADNGL